MIQVLLPLPWLRGLDGRLQMVLDWRDPAVRRVFTLMVPVTIGLGLINFNAVVDSIFASRLIDPNLAPSAIDKAFRIYMLPQGMFSVAVATVLFPSLARLATRGDLDGFRHTVGVGLRQIAFLLVPASVFCGCSGRADRPARSTSAASSARSRRPWSQRALAAFALGLTFNGTMLMLNRAFFSLQSPWLPTAVALGQPRPERRSSTRPSTGFGIWGIPLATTRREHRRHGRAARVAAPAARAASSSRESIGAFVRIVLASAVLAVVAYGVWRALDDGLGRSFGRADRLGLASRSWRARSPTGCPAVRWEFASSRRCARCAGNAAPVIRT